MISRLLGEKTLMKGENPLFLDLYPNPHSYIAIFHSPDSCY